MTIRPIVVEIVLISSVPRIEMSTFLAAPHAKAPRHLAISPDSRTSDGFVYQEGSRRGLPRIGDSSGRAPAKQWLSSGTEQCTTDGRLHRPVEVPQGRKGHGGSTSAPPDHDSCARDRNRSATDALRHRLLLRRFLFFLEGYMGGGRE